MNKSGANRDDGFLGGLGLVKGIEPGVGNGLGDFVLADGASGNALESLDGLLGSLRDGRGGAGEGDGQETGIGVSEALGRGGGTGGGGNLGEEGEAGRPLDGGLAAEERSKHGRLRAGRREGDGDGVANLAVDALLTTIIGGGSSLGALAGGGNLVEELGSPLGDGTLGGAVGDEGNVGLGVDLLGEGGNRVLIKIAVGGSGRLGIHGGTEAVVEGNGVSGVQRDGGRVGSDLELLEVDRESDLLVELMS